MLGLIRLIRQRATWVIGRRAVLRARQRVAAYALILDEVGRVLLTRQPGGRGRFSRWLLPGGGVEHGEHPEEAVLREVREETGMHVEIGLLRDVVSDVATVGRRRRVLHSVRLIYLATVVPARPDSPACRLSDNAHWCTRQEWQTLSVAPFVAKVLDSGAG